MKIQLSESMKVITGRKKLKGGKYPECDAGWTGGLEEGLMQKVKWRGEMGTHGSPSCNDGGVSSSGGQPEVLARCGGGWVLGSWEMGNPCEGLV